MCGIYVYIYIYIYLRIRTGKYLPSLAKVLITERDEYISQTLIEVASQISKRGAYSNDVSNKGGSKCSILAVVGAGW
mgnify:CR=1 FL=1